MGRHFVWDSFEDNVTEEFDDDGNLIAEYYTEPERYGNVLGQNRADSGVRYFIPDANGSTVASTDSSGNVTDMRQFDAFGSLIATTGATLVPYAFAGAHGYYSHPLATDIYVRARSYDCRLARWRSVDPLYLASQHRVQGKGSFIYNVLSGVFDRNSVQQTEHEYVYVQNNPINRFDPSGESDISQPLGTPPNPTPVAFPAPNTPNNRAPLGFNICCWPTRKKNRLRPIKPHSVSLPSPPLGPMNGSNEHYAPPFTGPIGAAGCGSCICIVIKCPSGIAVYHFNARDNPYWTLKNQKWPLGCEAVVCGGNDEYLSNCLAVLVLDGAHNSGINVIGVSGSDSCGVTETGDWYVR